MVEKILVANRGEIAVRVLRAIREAGLTGVAVYTDIDRRALHLAHADEAYPVDSYLNSQAILEAARRAGAGALHPGYGFLSENAGFAALCAEAGLVFIGPAATAIRALGSKTAARDMAVRAGAPVVPGTDGPVRDISEARRVAAAIGYPVLIKAAAGGGGKGMRLVEKEGELESALRDAASEAERSFQSGEVYIEKALIRPRHIEIQIFGDNYGNLIHFGERECSIQRRHQKVIEECPSPLVANNPAMRQAMGEAALRVARAAGYTNAGTAEFLVDAGGRFYFLEMNTRLQVEHPVTELVTSVDLVHMQLDAAFGGKLALRQDEVTWRGAAIQCRLYAEDPANQYFPSPGRIDRLRMPSGPGIRLDNGVYEGWTVPIDYDPLLAKLCVWAEDRPKAIARMQRALRETEILGIANNVAFFRQVLADARFVSGDLHTGFLKDFDYRPDTALSEAELEAAIAVLAAAEPKQARAPLVVRSNWSRQ
ncbi:MAG: acetyl-CoA carboxylase biotin carboxylase subunit [Acidobacteria bacterium]|nr:acetyl-CoA carboxylase biotin carboxylase subunit [Acidobacteriota bacterium]